MALTEQQFQSYAGAIRGINNGQYGVRNGITGQVVGAYDIIPSTYNWLSQTHPEANLGSSDTRTPEQEDRAFRILADQEASALERNGLAVTPSNLAVVHFFGVGGGPRVLKAGPNTPLSTVFGSDWGAIAAANPQIRNWTVADAQNWGANLAGETPMAFADTGAAPAPGVQAANQMATGGNPGGSPAQEAPSAFPRLQQFLDRQQMREQGRLPILENIRSRLQSRGRDTPFLDMIINSAAKGQLVVPRESGPSQDKTPPTITPVTPAPTTPQDALPTTANNLDATNPASGAPPSPGSLIPAPAPGTKFALPQPAQPPTAPASSVPTPTFSGTRPLKPAPVTGTAVTPPGASNDANAADFYRGGQSDMPPGNGGLETVSLLDRFKAPAPTTSPYAAPQPAQPASQLATAGSLIGGVPYYVPPSNNLAAAGQTYQSPVLQRIMAGGR